MFLLDIEMMAIADNTDEHWNDNRLANVPASHWNDDSLANVPARHWNNDSLANVRTNFRYQNQTLEPICMDHWWDGQFIRLKCAAQTAMTWQIAIFSISDDR
jgi:hypothetical protein